MRRSLGVTLSAVALFIFSTIPLIFGALAVESFFSPPSIPFPGVSVFRAVITVMSLTALGLASWGIVSGIGLIGLRRWARASMLVISSLMIYLSLPPVFIMPFWHVRYVGATAFNFNETARISLAVFYAGFAALGIFWLYFFNTRSVKEQFQPAAAN